MRRMKVQNVVVLLVALFFACTLIIPPLSFGQARENKAAPVSNSSGAAGAGAAEAGAAAGAGASAGVSGGTIALGALGVAAVAAGIAAASSGGGGGGGGVLPVSHH